MKKTLLACSILALATVAQAKEMVPAVTNSKEVVATPAPVVEEVVVAPVVTPLPWGYVNLRAGWDFWGKYDSFKGDVDFEKLEKDAKNFGGEIGVELYKTITPQIDLGLGVSYQKHMDRKDNTYGTSGAEYQSVPIYLTAKYKLNYWDYPVVPYLKANFGYSFNFDSKDISYNDRASIGTSVDDGMYWAAGIGFDYNNFNVDVLYGINYAETKNDYDHRKVDNNYQRVTLSVGYKFDI